MCNFCVTSAVDDVCESRKFPLRTEQKKRHALALRNCGSHGGGSKGGGGQEGYRGASQCSKGGPAA